MKDVLMLYFYKQENFLKFLIGWKRDEGFKIKKKKEFEFYWVRNGRVILYFICLNCLFLQVNLVSWLVFGGVDLKSVGDNGKQFIYVVVVYLVDVILCLVELDCDVN